MEIFLPGSGHKPTFQSIVNLRTAVFVLSLLVCALTLRAEETARFTLRCLSVRFAPTIVNYLGTPFTFSLERYSISGVPPNGELRPDFSSSVGDFTQLIGFYEMVSRSLPALRSDDILLPLPPFVDANTNGVNDFFEIDQSVPAFSASGTFEDSQGGRAKYTLTWSRDAGANAGLCELAISSTGLKIDATFPVQFHLLEYSGDLKYTPEETQSTGQVRLQDSENATNFLSGEIKLNKDGADLLDVAAGSWKDSRGRAFAYQGFLPVGNDTSLIERYGTNYFGLLAFTDGDLDTPQADYLVWALSISDANDANGDGIPDLSDPVVPPQLIPPPSLALRLEGTKLILSINGTVGKTCTIEQTSDLAGGNWTAAFSAKLMVASQDFILPPPTNNLTFWRATAR